MSKLCFSLQELQPVQFILGGSVRYMGEDPKLQQDYGNQDLQIVAIDRISGIAVCDTAGGQRLVGIALRELKAVGIRPSVTP